MKFTKFISMLLVLVLGAGMLAGCSAGGYTAKNTEFVIGVSGPLTGDAGMSAGC